MGRIARNPTNCRPPGSSVHEILQAGMLERAAIPLKHTGSDLKDLPGRPLAKARLHCLHVPSSFPGPSVPQNKTQIDKFHDLRFLTSLSPKMKSVTRVKFYPPPHPEGDATFQRVTKGSESNIKIPPKVSGPSEGQASWSQKPEGLGSPPPTPPQPWRIHTGQPPALVTTRTEIGVTHHSGHLKTPPVAAGS